MTKQQRMFWNVMTCIMNKEIPYVQFLRSMIGNDKERCSVIDEKLRQTYHLLLLITAADAINNVWR